ncbi:BTB/POZ-like protein [Cynara cardunculus var. scolymus]|uniref:BTB/POZ-like protein n=1 Tax=Cynara cardunculus var. scolymus TaxID=59895 RepID=A0A103YJ23_CYNCS|nr:BTB/POZ-like protein [Cynara cardunculus var. scolymus]
MDCSVCSTMPYNLRPPRNTICVACYEGAKSIIAMTNKIDDHKVSGKFSGETSVPGSSKATRSNIFKNMLDSDGCKAAPNDMITLPELNHEEVESLLEFLYSGDLCKEKLDKHLYSLSIAADKYEITFLQKFCENRMLEILNASNALDILEISDTTCNRSLKDTALSFVVKNMEDIVFATRFDVFALKNPHLTVQITRASFMDIKNRRNDV